MTESRGNAPYALREAAEQVRRHGLMSSPHMRPLASYIQNVVGRECPMFDPCDGGVAARALFLLEAPGRKAKGSGFISRNNPDPTACNMCRLMAEAGIDRKDTLLWNVVPWYIGTEGKIRGAGRADVEESLPYLPPLIALLPRLEVIVLMGKPAARAEPVLRGITSVPILRTCHPHPRVARFHPSKGLEAEAVFREVAQLLSLGP